MCPAQVHARAHLPSLEDKAGIHVECVDTYGTKHRFRYCSWINNSSRMYLLEGVAPALVRPLLAALFLHHSIEDQDEAVVKTRKTSQGSPPPL